MGEKSGALTNMIIGLVITVAIILVAQVAFPNLTNQITDGMSNIVSGTLDDGKWDGK
ncbi:hypothetical protein P9386_10265 [Caldifermentibacillus hisashii]|jgi:hypothetical protein|uniref:hypothetical protein n=1 Tax=Caldifermentibacillus hisashii TaxID=996558 RepID=UPI0022B9850F|nr:hypothetical protein [Caldifermentibacillus hisashii]MED4852200.1 hypothetical protein [Caldifermentibacillus hisashii]